jgi:methylmalonyl-CoA mutase N-terminal domain/subunit
LEAGERVVVGVNAFAEKSDERIELLHIDPTVERRQLQRTARIRAERNAEESAAAIGAVVEAARGEANLLPPMREALRARCTVGEICETLREEWGMYDALRARA